MIDIKGVAHFTIPVSDMERSKRFYTDIVGMEHLSTLPNGKMAFFDAGGMCIILVKREAPIHRDRSRIGHSAEPDLERWDCREDQRENG